MENRELARLLGALCFEERLRLIGDLVIPPFLTVCIGRDYAAMASRCFGVNPPKAMLGRS